MVVKNERNITVYDKTYRWAVGKSGAIIIYTPDGKKHVTNYTAVTGHDWRCWEDMQHHDYGSHDYDAVKPSKIRTYIEKTF